jgi:hypothetical protein
MRELVLVLLAISVPLTGHAASYQFSWTGSNGYRLEGALSIPDALDQENHIDERAVECFWIKGYRGDNAVGQWDIGQLMPETNWSLNFEPQTLRFRTGGLSTGSFGQEWNMNGNGRGCGAGGFGFNAGGYAQDVCINNALIRLSQVPSETPLTAIRNDQIRFNATTCIFVEIS